MEQDCTQSGHTFYNDELTERPVNSSLIILSFDIERLEIPSFVLQSVTLAGLIYLRWKEPDRERPIKMPIILPILVFLFCIIILVVIIYNDTSSTLFLIVGVVSGTMFYCVMTKANK